MRSTIHIGNMVAFKPAVALERDCRGCCGVTRQLMVPHRDARSLHWLPEGPPQVSLCSTRVAAAVPPSCLACAWSACLTASADLSATASCCAGRAQVLCTAVRSHHADAEDPGALLLHHALPEAKPALGPFTSLISGASNGSYIQPWTAVLLSYVPPHVRWQGFEKRPVQCCKQLH